MMLFSERYDENICGEFDIKIKVKIAKIMQQFAEPQIEYPNRYDSFNVKTDALSSAILAFEELKEFSFWASCYNDDISYQFTLFLFDVIELQYEQLSVKERTAFQSEINNLFSCNDIPWILCDGRLVKIDAQQFECDLKAKALAQIQELKDIESKFQPAYSELVTAIDALEKGNYQEAISNAAKSYESILKVILGADRGNADKLTKQYMGQFLSVPDTMEKAGFKEKVMMSLPYVRNNSGADHGAGSKNVVISKPMAKLAVNLAAALDTYLIEEYRTKLATSVQDTLSETKIARNDIDF